MRAVILRDNFVYRDTYWSMYRRSVLGGVSFAIITSLAGCIDISSERTTPGNTSQDDSQTADPREPETEDPGDSGTEQPDRTINEE